MGENSVDVAALERRIEYLSIQIERLVDQVAELTFDRLDENGFTASVANGSVTK